MSKFGKGFKIPDDKTDKQLKKEETEKWGQGSQKKNNLIQAIGIDTTLNTTSNDLHLCWRLSP
jgi:hypothetical protein